MSANSNPPAIAPSFARAVAVHSLGWLVAANLVGVWLGVSLLWPEVGNLTAPLSYGRWTPLHLDWQLYGWCSLPLVGALFTWCFEVDRPARASLHARLALTAWSAALVLGGIAWLGGAVSGKLFLDWHGWTRPLLPIAMYLLWATLALNTWRRWKSMNALSRGARAAILGMLLLVPAILFWATGRSMYHSVNPDSGGATGAAVLGSSLGIITIFMCTPAFLGVQQTRRVRPFVWALVVSWLVFATTDRGHVSHHVVAQIVSLSVLLVWIPLLPMFWWRHAWPRAAWPWLRAATGWWCLLVITGWISFLPGVSEAFKFTHALVGHAHLAMAGLITSVNAAILVTITRRSAPRSAFWLWQGGCAIFIASMLALGGAEAGRSAELFRSEPWTQTLLATRLLGGIAMTAGSVRWLVMMMVQR
jgi:cytochrome c oxidase cbb3-type subunit 1